MALLGNRPVEVAENGTDIEDVVRRIAAECAYKGDTTRFGLG